MGSMLGLIWWHLGPLTLLPLILTGECDWRAEAGSKLLPSLVGHLIYGAVMVLAFFFFERRYWTELLADPRSAARESGEFGRQELPRRLYGCSFWGWVYCCQYCWAKKWMDVQHRSKCALKRNIDKRQDP
jgi:hypothetical protein